LDADRDEEEVFSDISMMVDNKLFPTKEPVAGPSELDLSVLADSTSLAEGPTRSDEQAIEEVEVEEEEAAGYGEGTAECFPIEKRKPKVIFVIGGPGSGKALQCEKMEERYGLKRLCPGDMLCTELQSHSERGRFLRDLLETGRQLPEDTLLDLLCESMESTVRQGKGFLIIGFPRDLRQAEDYDAKVRERECQRVRESVRE
ncbi:adenylate kinase isoenzyme 5 isoform X2, partial [Tachysurus ichikawai]